MAEAVADEVPDMGQQHSGRRHADGGDPQRDTEPAQEAASPGDVFVPEAADFSAKPTVPPTGRFAGRAAGFSSPETSLSPERPSQNGERRSSLQRWMLAAARVREGSFAQEAPSGSGMRKMSAETSWDKWDPELTVKMIRVPSVQNYGKIRRVLQLADR